MGILHSMQHTQFENGYVLEYNSYIDLFNKAIELLDAELNQKARNTEIISCLLREMSEDIKSLPVELKVSFDKVL